MSHPRGSSLQAFVGAGLCARPVKISFLKAKIGIAEGPEKILQFNHF